jgi:hypothetical protein
MIGKTYTHKMLRADSAHLAQQLSGAIISAICPYMERRQHVAVPYLSLNVWVSSYYTPPSTSSPTRHLLQPEEVHTVRENLDCYQSRCGTDRRCR